MPTFHYKAKKGSSETITGQIEARSENDAIELMNQQGLLPISIEEKTFAFRSKGNIKGGRVTSKEVFYFSRQLASLIKSGIPILRALNLIGKQTQNAYFKSIVDAIERGIKEGKTFSDCLADYPKIFNPFYIAMVRTGEESGNLKEILESVTKHQRSQEEISSKVRSALAYPIFMAVVGITTVVFILTFVMPRITNLFSNAGEALPIPTKILIQISAALRGGWYWILLVVFGIIFLFRKWQKSAAGGAVLSRIKLQLPLYGPFLLKVELARFCRTLELLLRSGIPILKAIKIALPTLNNELIKEELRRSQKDLESGASFGSGFKNSKLIPVMMSNLIAVGEESGLLEEILGDIADSYEQETNETIKTMTTLLEPMMILVVGLVVGFIVMAMLLPIFQMDIMAR